MERLTADERNALDDVGYVVLDTPLPDGVVAAASEALDRATAGAQATFKDGNAVVVGTPLWAHQSLTDLIDQPLVLPKIVDALGWNIHVYDQAASVTPPAAPVARSRWRRKKRSALPTAFGWHRDGGRLNGDLGGLPPRVALKAAFFLSDVSAPDRGNLAVAPGSHEWPTVDPAKADKVAVPICGPAGTVAIFDTRILHTATPNRSDVIRKAVFYGYAYRWVASMGPEPPADLCERSDPVRRQLLGETTDAFARFFPSDESAPLRSWTHEGHDDATRLRSRRK